MGADSMWLKAVCHTFEHKCHEVPHDIARVMYQEKPVGTFTYDRKMSDCYTTVPMQSVSDLMYSLYRDNWQEIFQYFASFEKNFQF